jgi:hypothetical protein
MGPETAKPVITVNPMELTHGDELLEGSVCCEECQRRNMISMPVAQLKAMTGEKALDHAKQVWAIAQKCAERDGKCPHLPMLPFPWDRMPSL